MTDEITLYMSDIDMPMGRYRSQGDSSGEAFRDDVLIPAFEVYEWVYLHLDNGLGYGSSFLEEVFGGLVRNTKMTLDEMRHRFSISCHEDPRLVDICWGFITDEFNRQ